jgi:2-oxoglutarate ferredoxin oxidoreductase subunit gamma
MQEEYLFAGFGGQGVMFAGQLLAFAAMDAGLEVTWIPSYGPEMRGGTAHCYVVLSDKPIGSPVVRYPGVVIAFNIPSYDKYEALVAPGGLVAYNSTLITRPDLRTDITYLPVPASTLAEELGNLKLANVIMLGAVLTMQPVISHDDLKVSFGKHIPNHRRDMLELNLKALDVSAEFVAQKTDT